MYEAIRQAFPEHRFFVIEDFHAPELDIYARLTEAQLRSSHGIDNSLFIAESPHVIERALDAGCVPESLLMLPKMLDGRERGQEILRRCGDVPVYVAEEDCLKQLTGFPLTRGVLCAMRRPPLPQAEDLLKTAERIARKRKVSLLFSAVADKRWKEMVSRICRN